MTPAERSGPAIEPERYELFEPPRFQFELLRREFLKAAGGGLLLLLALDEPLAQEPPGGRRRGGRGEGPREIGAWLHLGEDGTVTVRSGKVEVGQNVRTSLAQAVAEELRVPVTSVRVALADTDLVPFDGGTSGSRSTPDMHARLRRIAAAARELLTDLAAEKWKTERASVAIADGRASNRKTGESIELGKLTGGEKIQKTVEEGAPTTPAAEWKVCGTSVPRPGARDFVTGAHRYASDQTLPGMLHGKVLRPPAFGAKLVFADLKDAEAVEGAVVVRDGDFIGACAPSAALAARALKAVGAEWRTEPQVSQRELFARLRRGGGEERGRGGRGGRRRGSVEEGLKGAWRRLEETYTVAYIAHVPLEPRAALAEWKKGKLTVWTGTQRPFGVRGDLARAFGIAEERVRVIVPDTGSGYGGKHTVDTAIEAARLAKAAQRPVKVVWTREEEFTWAYFRPAGVIEVRSGLRENGTLLAWEFHNYNSGGSAIDTIYEVPHQLTEFHPASSPLRQGSYRSLAATANHFARESHMDGLADAAGLDPLEFRLRNLKEPRLRAVLEAACERFGWKRREKRPGRGFGLACGSDKGSYVATCAEAAIEGEAGEVKAKRLVTAFECGAVVHPEHLKSQVEGAVVMGIGGALFEAIEFEDGRILNPRLSRYRVPRFSDAPDQEVVLLDRKHLPSAGAGETPIVAVAPALGNAVFDAAGVRIRSLPLAPRGMRG